MKPKKLKSFRNKARNAVADPVQLLMNLAKPIASPLFLPSYLLLTRP